MKSDGEYKKLNTLAHYAVSVQDICNMIKLTHCAVGQPNNSKSLMCINYPIALEYAGLQANSVMQTNLQIICCILSNCFYVKIV